MNLQDHFEAVLGEIAPVLRGADEAEFAAAAERLAKAGRLFLAGAGRSGLVMRMFAMRLAQAGRTVHIVGDATTPAIGRGDLLVLGSGSGRTATPRTLAERARDAGADILLLTYSPDSPLGVTADAVWTLPVPKDTGRPGGLAGGQLLGTLFDQCLLMAADALVRAVCERTSAAAEDLARRHANLE